MMRSFRVLSKKPAASSRGKARITRPKRVLYASREVQLLILECVKVNIEPVIQMFGSFERGSALAVE